MTPPLTVCLLLLLWAAPPAAAQGKPRVHTELGRTSIYQGESVLYQVDVQNTLEAEEPDLSAFTEFEVVLRDRQPYQHMEIVNFQRRDQRGVKFTYRLTPASVGRITVPAAVVKVGGETLRGREHPLRVVAPEQQDYAYLHVEADPPTVYPMSEFTLTLKVFARKLRAPYESQEPLNVGNAPRLHVPWADVPDGLEGPELAEWLGTLRTRDRNSGFEINDVVVSASIFSLSPFGGREAARFDLDRRVATAAELREIPGLAGRESEFWAYELRRRYQARRVGRYSFRPASLKASAVESVARDGRPSMKDIYTLSNALDFTVRDVPLEGRPASYTGGVGNFRIEASISPKRAKVFDPLTLTVTVTGEGNLEDIGPPALETLPAYADSFRLYEPTTQTKGSRRLFTYSLRAATADVTEVPPIPLAYFDIKSGRYEEVETGALPLSISAAEQLDESDIVGAERPGTRSSELEASAEGLFANITDHGQLVDHAVDWHRSALWLGAMTAGYVLAAALLGWVRNRSEDPARVRRRGAPARARKRLSAASALLSSADAAQVIPEARGALVGLIADVQGTPEAGFTHKDAGRTVVQLGLKAELAGSVAQVISEWDAKRYGAGAEDLAELHARTSSLVDELVKAFKARRLLG